MMQQPASGLCGGSTAQEFHFAEFTLDQSSYRLQRGERLLRLEKLPMELLILLVQRHGELVSREEIAQRLWGKDVFLDIDHSINTAIRKIRVALRDDPEKPQFVETVVGKGYRFAAQVICKNGDANLQAPPLPSPVQVRTDPATEKRVVENGTVPATVIVEGHLAPIPPSGPTPQAWNRRPFLVTAAVAAFVIVAALATWRVFFYQPGLAGSDVIVLATFANKTGDPVFDNSLDKALEVKLTESPFLSIFPEADARATMRMMRHDPNGPVTRNLAIEICKRQGLNAVVIPEIAAFGSRYLITLEAIDAHTQKSIALKEEEAESKDKVIAALGKAASGLRKQLGESLSSLKKYNAPLDLATTGSLEALQAYRTGQTLYRSGKRREAAAFFERAVELDPQFCSAYSMLGSVYHSTGDEQASKRNIAIAFQLKDRRLTQEENFQTTALYHLSTTGNLEKATAVLVLYKQVYPRSVTAANLLGIAYAQQGRTQEGLQQFYWAIDHSPVPSAQHYSNAGQALMILGRFDEAKKVLDQWSLKGSLTPFQIMLRYQIAVSENDSATMERLAGGNAGDDEVWLNSQLQFAFYRGDFRKIRMLSETLVEQERHAKRMENAASDLAWHAWTESYAGNYALARQLCRQAGEVSDESPLGLVHCAWALGAAGDVRQAEELAAELDRLRPEDTFIQKICLPQIRSVITRKRGTAVEAADLLAAATQYPNGMVFYHRAQAYLAAGEPAKASADFEKLIGQRGWPEWELFAPLAQLGLARAYAMEGDRDKSRKAYDDFFTDWKEADPDIPILRQAKAEYKKLTAKASSAALISEK